MNNQDFLSLQHEFRLNEEKYMILPRNYCASNFYCISFDGWKEFTLHANDPIFDLILKMASQTMHALIEHYQYTHAFTQPQFCLKPDGMCQIKIGTLEKERYEKYMREDRGQT